MTKERADRLEKMIDRMAGTIVDLRAEVAESNSMLRSAFMVAKRDGKDTNWVAFRRQVKKVLTRQQKLMRKQDIRPL